MSFIPPNNSTPPTPTSAKGSRAAGGPFSGMFRRKARRAIRDGSSGGGGGGHRNVAIEGGVTDSSDSTAPVAENCLRGNCSTRSQFITPRAGNVFVEPSRSFYFSPLNSWHEHGQPNRTGNDVANMLHLQTGMDTLITVDVERMLRQIVIYCVIFIAGTIMSDHASVAYHLLELSLVAWGTSLFILIVEKRRLLQNAPPPERFLGSNDMELKPTQSFEHNLQGYFDEDLPSIRRKRSRHENIGIEPDNEVKQTPPKVEPEVAVEPVVSSTAIKQQNTHLENLYVMMVGKQERIIPNCSSYDIDTDLFSGKMLLMFRTPDVDEPSKTDDPIVNYFRGKQRRFEFQWQLRLKKLPPGDLFLGVEVDEPIQMGMIQRALANTALKFTKKMNQGFSYCFSDSAESPSFLSFPVGTSMDRFNVTNIGDPLPILGQEITEDPETLKQRKKGMKIQWNTNSVYTMALWSAYADWSDWQILNFPGIRPFSITSLVGVQPIKLTLYTQQNLERQIRDIIFTIEVSHGSLTTLGSEAQKWIADGAAVGERTSKVETLAPSEIDSFNRNESFGDDYELDDQFDDDDKYEEDLVDADAIAELVDPETSCYLLSGTSVSLREGAGHYVASGGGYAVLQSGRASIVMEKFQPKSKKGTSCSSAVIIRSGDVVRVQLVDVTSKAVKFLAIHRGWWLRWSSARPKRNGLFCVHTGELNGSPVLLGSPFSLTSLRWSHYTVGACFDSSVKYGGRMLGIFKTGRVSANDEMGYGEEYESEIRDSEIRDDIDVPELLAIEKDKRMMPLLLRAESWACFPPELSPSKVLIQESRLGRTLRNDDDISAVPVLESLPTVPKHVEVDIPVWLEIMNRTKRTKQLVYAVRFKEAVSIKSTESTQSSGTITNSGDDNLPHSPTYRMSLKLLTGRELAHMLQLGVEQKSDLSPTPDLWQQRFDFDNRDELNDADSFISSSDDSDSDDDLDEDGHDDLHNHHFLIAGPNHTVNGTIPSGQEDFVTVVSGDRVHDTETHGIPSDQENSTNSAVEDRIAGRSKNSCEAESSVDYSRLIDTKHQIGEDDLDQQCSIGSKKKSKVKHAAVIGRVAKTVKASTVITGKHVIKQSMNITKGTVSAGRAAGRVIPVSSVVYSKPPRKHEPGGRVHGRRADKSHMKMIGRAIKNIENTGKISTSLLSGQLLSPDQSCRKMSHFLLNSCNTSSITSMLAATNSTEDFAFLRGGSAELGVKPLQPIDPTFDVDCLIARCIYDGHWREELCVLHTKEQYIALYAPLSKKPSVTVSFEEIMAARKCDESSACPLPGLHFLAIDTTWKCHYLAFLDADQRDNFMSRLSDALFHAGNGSVPSQSRKVLPEFESYRMSLETSLTGTAGKWRAVSTGKNSKHSKQRRVLNGRRMAFDLEPIISNGADAQEEIALYVEKLLRMALSFCPDTLNALESRFIEFLDQASRLRTLPLQVIDFSSKEAFCIFVNLYHLLLQHSLLLAVDGLPNMRSVKHFKRCSCYEIGEDVFSLAELESCVIRGNTGRPSYIKPPFVDAPKTSRPYLMYALSATDSRINFILNPGDKSYPSAVPVLQKEMLDDQLDAASACFLTSQVKIDKRKRTVFLPKVCDAYALDFGMGDGLVCLSQCIKYLDEGSQNAIAELLENGVVSVKFNCASENFHPSLTELLC